MGKKIEPNEYHKSVVKRVLDIVCTIMALPLLVPVVIFLFPVIKFTNTGLPFFKQKRVGKNGKVFTLIKFRTMIVGAENLRAKYKRLNIADGPVFKIPNDPRFTKFGKYLAKSGLDELPQLINVLRGEMSIVGPRPLPLNEAKKLTKRQKIREAVLPGITSSWVVQGAHNMKFKDWMKLDREYVHNANLTTDILIIIKTVLLICSIGIKKIIKNFF